MLGMAVTLFVPRSTALAVTTIDLTTIWTALMPCVRVLEGGLGHLPSLIQCGPLQQDFDNSPEAR